MSLIIENLYLSSVSESKDAKFVKDRKIQFILIAAKSLKKHFTNLVTYKQLNISDNPTTLIIKHFVESIEFIYSSRQQGAVLVHCLGGKSRSATIVMAYVMFQKQMSAKEAMEFVKKQHPKAYPNNGFIKQLNQFEKVLQIYFKNADVKQPKFGFLQEILSSGDLGESLIEQDEEENDNDNNLQQFDQ